MKSMKDMKKKYCNFSFMSFMLFMVVEEFVVNEKVTQKTGLVEAAIAGGAGI
jgi:hypothetical protein